MASIYENVPVQTSRRVFPDGGFNVFPGYRIREELQQLGRMTAVAFPAAPSRQFEHVVSINTAPHEHSSSYPHYCLSNIYSNPRPDGHATHSNRSIYIPLVEIPANLHSRYHSTFTVRLRSLSFVISWIFSMLLKLSTFLKSLSPHLQIRCGYRMSSI